MATRRTVNETQARRNGSLPTRDRRGGRIAQRGRTTGGWLARIGRQSAPALALEAAVVVGLLALLYLSQVAAVNTANSRLQSLQAQQTDLRRTDTQAHAQLAQAQSVATIDRRARAMGLRPAAPGVIVGVTPTSGGGR
jgi:hypothetical protein